MARVRASLSIRFQLLALFGLLIFTGLGVLAIDEVNDRATRAAQSQLKDQSLNALRRIKAVSDAYALDITDTAFKVRNELMGVEQAVGIIDSALLRVRQHWGELQQMARTPEQQTLFAQIAAARIPADAAAVRLREILLSRDIAELGRFCDVELYPAIDPVTTRLKFLSDLEMIAAEAVVREDIERAHRLGWLRVGLSLGTLLIVAVVGRSILRNIYRGVESLRRLTVDLRRRDFEAAPGYRPHGELGEVMDGFLAMRDDVLGFETELQRSLESTERVREELAQRELFQRSLLSAAQTAIMALDGEGRFTHLNPFAESLLGYRAEELVGRDSISRVLAPEQIEGVARELGTVLGRAVAPDWRLFRDLAESALPPREWRLLRKSGERVPTLLAVSAMQDEEGELLGLLLVATDLTEIKQLEAELRESEARAREASHAKSAFLAAMSHEIRTPMIGVTGMVEVLSHTPLDEDQRRSLAIIQHSAESLLQIIGDILDFSKIEAGRLELAPVTASLREVLANAVQNFMGAASSKGLQLEAEIDERIAPAHRVDAVRLRQIVSNFLSNAIKFTEQGGVYLRLDSLGRVEGGERLRLSVRDTGIGVSAEQQQRLFQPFAQAEASTTRRYGGTGLGLTICRRLAELMGGELSMESAPGRGTTLRLELRLPLGRAEDIERSSSVEALPPLPLSPRDTPSVAEAEAAGSLILLVDDHPTNRVVIARQLALAGFACESAPDGEAGLAAWRSGRYGLVLSDVHMPKLDGYQMTQAIRADEAARGLHRTPVIALTAAALKGEAERCLGAGMDDYLTKPVAIPVLVERLRRWLPKLDASRPAPAGAPSAQEATGSAPVVLDRSVLGQLAGGDAGVQDEILADFLASCRGDLEALRSHLGATDLPALGSDAHRIKGAARLVGAMELATCAEAVEDAARHGRAQTVHEACAAIESALARLQARLGSGA
jgi:two-component system, NarL family, sensor histidine kinase EvgS